MTPASPLRPRRAAPTAKPDQASEAVAHEDISALTGAVRDLAHALQPLKALAEHVPTLVEMAQSWNAGKTGVRVVGRVGMITGTVAKWIVAVGSAGAILYGVTHAKWDLIIKAFSS